MYKMIDLCAGIGGMRRGFELTGSFTNVLSAEIDRYAIRTYMANFAGDNPENDLTSENFKRKVKETSYDILLAGFPCQPFSSAGNKKGFDDEDKGTIFFHLQEIIADTRPKAVFLENVQNIVSHDKGKTIEKIIHTLEVDLNYKVIGVTYEKDANTGQKVYKYSNDSFVRNTRYFGLPQNRPRAYFMAFDRSLFGDAVEKLTNELPREKKGRKEITVSDILDDTVDIHYYMSATYLETLERHKVTQKKKGNGFGYCIVNAADRTLTYANTILATGGSGKERNLICQKMPPYTQQDIARLRKKGGLNKKNIRVMTPEEWGRLQGFIGYGFMDADTKIDRFKFPDKMPEGQKYKQFGNAVSIPVVEEMAKYMLQCFEKLYADQESIIINYLAEHECIKKIEVERILLIDAVEATNILSRMCKKGILKKVGNTRNLIYISNEL